MKTNSFSVASFLFKSTVLSNAIIVICAASLSLSSMATDTSNINFQLAADFINYTHRSVFLTGKAGTGKTTFLKYIKEHSVKQTAIVAPTGVAAINAGGATIHSFFQLPFTPYIPETRGFSNDATIDKHHLLGRIKMNTERRKILQQLDLLIIDEISMVRADVLDAIDAVLRHFRNKHSEAFGGVQVLLIGDLFQLPPVVKDEEWKILSQYYSSPYFFSSRIMEQQPAAYVELDKIYRQRDQHFIDVLNKVRNNVMDEDGLNILHEKYNPSFQATKDDGYITLTTHNYKADAINANELINLKGKTFSFKAIVEGDFSEKAFPADDTLELKIGSQVMFIKNDMDKAKRFFNGKIGLIEKIDDDKIFVQCKDEPALIEVKKEVWRNIRYSLNKESQKVEESEIGSFTQYPLRLAWAITIHKSQGLTFEKAVVDAGQAFAPGQVYVALSRCTSLDGMVLLSKITPASLHSDERILNFSNGREKAQLPKELVQDKHQYQTRVLLNLFDFAPAIKQATLVVRDVEEQVAAFNEEALSWVQEILLRLENLQQVFKKFEPQLLQLFQNEILPENNEQLQQRIIKAAIYFDEHLQWLVKHLHHSPTVTDSKQYALAYNEDIKDLFILLCQQAYAIEFCKNGFTVDAFHQHKKSFVLASFTVNAYAGATYRKTDSKHPLLHQQLRSIRDEICASANLPLYIVAGSNTIDEMANYLPQTPEQLKQISGFGDAKVAKYGKQFLEAIVAYCDEHNLSTCIEEKVIKHSSKTKTTKEPKAAKVDTKLVSFNLYKEGKSIEEICGIRNFAPQTIEGHLAHYVSLGEIKIDELVSREKLVIIEPAIAEFESGVSLTTIKEKLGDAASFGEIKLVLAWRDFEKSKET